MNKKKIVKTLMILVLLGALGFVGVMYVPKTDWYRNFTAKKGAAITASDIVKDFQTNEDSAFAKYSDKQIEVTGLVKESKIENGKTAVMLQSADSTIGVYFVLKDSIEPIKTGSETTIKGMCTGYLGDVQFNEGVIIKK